MPDSVADFHFLLTVVADTCQDTQAVSPTEAYVLGTMAYSDGIMYKITYAGTNVYGASVNVQSLTYISRGPTFS
jgi:cystathionine beta-lyase family protein involved in aluminum resistance